MADEKKSVDLRDLTLTAPVKIKEKGLIPFEVTQLPAGPVTLQLTKEQVLSGTFNVTEEKTYTEGKNKGEKYRGLVALGVPTPDGKVKLYELQKDTVVKIAIYNDKDAKEPLDPKDPSLELGDYKRGEAVNWFKAAEIKLDKMVADGTLKPISKTNGYTFHATKIGGGTPEGGVLAHFEVSRDSGLIKDAEGKVPLPKDSIYHKKDTQLNWDVISGNNSEAAAKAKKAMGTTPEPKKEESKSDKPTASSVRLGDDGLPFQPKTGAALS